TADADIHFSGVFLWLCSCDLLAPEDKRHSQLRQEPQIQAEIMRDPIFAEEHALIRDQLRRFVEEKVKPEGSQWEQAGLVPRTVLREMGGLGFLSLRVPEEFGGAGLDARAS